jgi:hypothetical protein
MALVSRSLPNNILVSAPNGLAVFVNDNDGELYLKDWAGNIQPISDYIHGGGGSGITSINALTQPAQFMVVGTSGNDFNIVSAGATHTFNMPNASATARGVVNTGAQTFAGVKTFSNNANFSADVDVVGTLTATAKSFLIAHPDTSKFGWMLQHGNLEGPEHAVYYRGKIVGSNRINLPSYWKFLVDERTISVTLTPIGSYQQLYITDVNSQYVEIKEDGDKSINCYYMVYGERKDIDKLLVEHAPEES